MKRTLVAAVCTAVLLLATTASGQQRPIAPTQGILIGMRPAAEATVQQRPQVQRLQTQPGAGQLNIARLQTQQLRDATIGQTLQFQLAPDTAVQARALSVEREGATTVFRGEIAGVGARPPGIATVVMTALGATGTIDTGDGRTFRLRPLPGGETAIVELNYRTMPPDHDELGGGSGGASGGQAQLRNPNLRTQVRPGVTLPPGTTLPTPQVQVQTNQIVMPTEDRLNDTGVARTLAVNPALLQSATRVTNVSLIERYRVRRDLWRLLQPPTIDVLVAYTPSAQTAAYDIAGLITTAITETNGSFTNSNVWAQVRLVGTMAVSYAESGRDYPTMVEHLTNTSDGQIDNVHAQRNTVSADVVVLIVNQPAKCGRAREIGANADQAFVVVDWGCATGYYSFGHEIAHLAGARHDEPTDTTDTPYAYGHGFRHHAAAPNGWRTIMGYICTDGTCDPRLQYWSSPLSTWAGVPMGTAADADNRRVWNQRASTLAGFR